MVSFILTGAMPKALDAERLQEARHGDGDLETSSSFLCGTAGAMLKARHKRSGCKSA